MRRENNAQQTEKGTARMLLAWRYPPRRTRIKGRLVTWSLHTADPKLAAERRKAGKDHIVAHVHHGDAKRSVVEVMESWVPWVKNQVGAKTAQRYACSLDQLHDALTGPNNVVKKSFSAVRAHASLREELAAPRGQTALQARETQLLGGLLCTPLSEKALISLAP